MSASTPSTPAAISPAKSPEHIAAYASTIDHDPRFAEVEENISWTMKFPSGILASLQHHLRRKHAGYFRVYGSKGWLQVDKAFVYEGLHLRAEYSGTKLDEPNPAKDPSHFMAEAAHFSRNIQDNWNPEPPAKKASATCAYITEIYRSAGIAI